MNAQVDELKPFRVAEAYCYDAGATNAAKNLRAAVAALIAERDALRFALRDIANNCRRGANEQGMSPQGVSAIAEICDAALTTGESA